MMDQTSRRNGSGSDFSAMPPRTQCGLCQTLAHGPRLARDDCIMLGMRSLCYAVAVWVTVCVFGCVMQVLLGAVLHHPGFTESAGKATLSCISY